MIRNYLKSAFRSFWKSKTTSFINVFCLTVGMTTVVLILLWVQSELSYDSYHPNASHIYRVTMHNSDNNTSEFSSLLLADAAKQQIPSITKTARLFTASFYQPGFILNGEKVAEKKYAYVDEGWFSMFHYDVVEGTTNSFGRNPFSLILTQSAARKYFGDQSAVGEFIQVDSTNYVVQAVIKDNPANSSFQFDIWLPNAAYLTDIKNRRNEENWGSGNYMTFMKLKRNADPRTISRQLSAILNRSLPDHQSSISLLPLTDIHFETANSSVVTHGNRITVVIFSILALLILLTACINYVTLTTAKAGARAKEVSVRKIIGAKRKHLFIQFIFDSLIVCCFALIFTLVLIQLLLPVFNAVTEKEFVVPVTSLVLWSVLGLTLLVTLLLSSIYPALLLSRFSPLAVFRGTGMLSSGRRYFFKSLIIIQFSFSIVLIISTMVIYKQLNLIQQSDKNFQRSQIFSVSLPVQYFWFNYTDEARTNLMATYKQELLSKTGIEGVSMGPMIIDIQSRTADNLDWEGREKNDHPVIASINADADFQKVFNLEMVEGKWFEEGNKTSQHDFILNETALKEFHLRSPASGQKFIFNKDTGRIIGVVKDFHYSSLHNKIAPLIIHNTPGRRFGFLIKAAPGAVSQALALTKNQWKKLIPGQPFSYSFMDESFESLYRTERKTSILITFFAIITVVISGLGLFGLTAFAAQQRVKEISIRKVLGATVAGIVNILTKDFVKLIALAFIVSCPVAWIAMNKWLDDFAYRVNISWWIFLGTGLMAAAIAVTTIGVQAVRAAISNPIKNLRRE